MPTFGPNQILVPDDGGTKAYLISAVDGSLIDNNVPILNNEFGARLPSGLIGVQHSGSNHLLIYDSSFNLVADATISAITGVVHLLSVAGDAAHTFYISWVNSTTTALITAVSDAGVVGASWTVPIPANKGISALGVAPDSSVLYYADTSTGGTVHRYDLINNAPLSDLFTAPGGALTAIGGELITIPATGDVLVSIQPDLSTPYFELRRYSAAGTLLQTIPLGNGAAGGDDIRVALDGTDPSAFWVRLFLDPAGGMTTFIKYSIAAGMSLRNFTVATGSGSLGVVPGSCPFFAQSTADRKIFTTNPADICTCLPNPTPGPLPPPTPTPVPPPCTSTTQTDNGGKGQAGCNTGSLTPPVDDYNGPWGTVPNHPDPVDGELLTGKRSVDAWFEFTHTNEISVNTKYRRAGTTLGDVDTYEGGKKSEGLISIGDVEHSISNEQGAPEAATLNTQYGDHRDRLFRELLDTEELEGDHIYVKLASPAARKAGLRPRVVFRGVLQQPPQTVSPLRVNITAIDSLFAEWGPFGTQRQWPPQVPKVFPNAPPDTLKMSLPWLHGRKSDVGSIDPTTGLQKSKGLCPLTYLGPVDTGMTGGTPLWTSMVGSVPRPGYVMGALGGSGNFISDGTGAQDPIHAVARIEADGTMRVLDFGRAATPSPVGTQYGFRIVWNDPFYDSLGPADHYIVFQIPYNYPLWDPVNNPAPTGAGVTYKIWPGGAPTQPYTDPSLIIAGHIAWQFGVVLFQSATDGIPLASSGVSASAATGIYDGYLIMGHPCFRSHPLYGSNGGGTDPSNVHDRVLQDLAALTAAGTVLHPDYPGYPGGLKYFPVTDTDGTVYWLCMMFVDPGATISIDHKKGVCTMAVNAIGREDVGDGTGLPLYWSEDCKQSWLENEIHNRWTSGPLADNVTYPMFEDGTPKVRSSSFRAVQALMASFGAGSEGNGLSFGWYVPSAQSPVAWAKVLADNTEAPFGINGHGQIVDFILNPAQDTVTWPHLRHVTRMFGTATRTGGILRENVAISDGGDWDPDFDKWRSPGQNIPASPSIIARFKGHKKPTISPIQFYCLVHPDQQTWVLQHRLTRLQEGLATFIWEGDLGLLDYDVGTGVYATTVEGTGTDGWIDRRMIIIRRRLNFSKKPWTVTLTLWDVESQMFNLGLVNGLPVSGVPLQGTLALMSNLAINGMSNDPAFAQQMVA